MMLRELEGRRVAIWGFGREGRSALAALRRRGLQQPLTVYCRTEDLQETPAPSDPALTVVTEPPTVDDLAQFEIVIKSPGISPYRAPANLAIARGVRFVSCTSLWFAEHAGARTVCVTGTKGKSTTSALIAHLLRAAGYRTGLAGNIGLPLLDVLDTKPPPAFWIIEVSSYQTRDVARAEVAVVLNLFPEHLDWHGSETRYMADKLALVSEARPRQVVLEAEDPRLVTVSKMPGRKHWFGGFGGWHAREDAIWRGNERVLPLTRFPLPGAHNRSNFCAALTALEALDLDAAKLAPAVSDFRPLPHRLQSLGAHDGIEYINDSISTTPHATLAALACYRGRPMAIIVGGYDRGVDWAIFAERIQNEALVAAITQGQNGPRIAKQLSGVARQMGFQLESVSDLEEAVRRAQKALRGHGVVLLSPGAPSFPRYRDYVERGRHFAEVAGFDPTNITGIPGLGIA